MKCIQRLLALCLCAAILVSLCSCRYSTVLEQIIYDLRRGLELDMDTNFKPEENDPENEETSDDLKDLEQDEEAERATEEAPELPPEQEEEDSGGEGAQVEYLAESDSELTASAGETVVPGSGDIPGGSDALEEGIENSPAPAEEETGGGMEGGDVYEPDSTEVSYKQVVDAYGRPVDIPENVDQVAAVGELAVMVMMLDGPERLAAVNSGLTGSSMAAQVFSGLSEVPGLWNGTGGSPLSADGFQALLETAPDVVLETSGSSTVTDSQAALLAENGIAYLVLPQPTSAANIRTIMTTLGTVLGDRSAEGGANAPQAAEDYLSWVDSVTGKISQATSSHAAYTDEDGSASVAATYTLYVDDWDDDAYYRLYSDTYVTLSGYGCAVINNGATVSCKTLSSYLGVAHVVNTAAQYGITPKAQYFTPLISAYRTMEVVGPGADGMVTAGQKLLEQTGGSLGTSSFPILLAADKHTAQAIQASELWAVYPHINSGDGSFNSDGFLDEEGNLVRTQISGEYEIVVNPSGLSSWAGGSAESVLESVWAAWRFFGAISETDMRGYIADFYSRFYGYTLSNTEIDHILEGQ